MRSGRDPSHEIIFESNILMWFFMRRACVPTRAAERVCALPCEEHSSVMAKAKTAFESRTFVDAVEAAERLTFDTVRKSNGERHSAPLKVPTERNMARSE
jgi:hypothetical protein